MMVRAPRAVDLLAKSPNCLAECIAAGNQADIVVRNRMILVKFLNTLNCSAYIWERFSTSIISPTVSVGLADSLKLPSRPICPDYLHPLWTSVP